MTLVFIILLLSFIAKTYRLESRVTIMIPEDTYVILCADMTSRWWVVIECLKNNSTLTSKSQCDVCYGSEKETMYIFNAIYIPKQKDAFNFTGFVTFMTLKNKSQDRQDIIGLKVNGTIKQMHVQFCSDVQIKQKVRIECKNYDIILTHQKRCNICRRNTTKFLEFKIMDEVDV